MDRFKELGYVFLISVLTQGCVTSRSSDWHSQFKENLESARTQYFQERRGESLKIDPKYFTNERDIGRWIDNSPHTNEGLNSKGKGVINPDFYNNRNPNTPKKI
jgi:hypothetical protein